MSGLGVVLDIAKEALLAQRYAIDVVSHNIANVNTPGYTRQSALLQAKDPAPLQGILVGRGVALNEIAQNSNSFIETRLRDQKSDLAALSEMGTYMRVLEGIFDESSGSSLSTQVSEFFNAWQDLSNNPQGMPERSILYERGAMLAENFQALHRNLTQMSPELANMIKNGVDKVNSLLSDIANLNQRIIQIEVNGNANDLRDQRNLALSQLGEYMDVKAYEHEDGNLTVTTGRGYILVSKSDMYVLRMEGEQIKWQGSGNNQVTITDTIAGGKLGGWLEMRDRYIQEYRANLNSLAGAFIWEVNKVHSQGAGLNGLDSVTGTYSSSNGDEPLGAPGSGLSYGNFIRDGNFSLWLYDATGSRAETTIGIDADATTLHSLADTLNAVSPGNLTAAVSGGKLTLTAENGCSFAFSSDTSHVLAALGINTFFTGSGAEVMGMNSLLNSDQNRIAAGRVDSTGAIAAGENANALAVSDIQHQSLTIQRWTFRRGSEAVSSVETGTLESSLHSMVSGVGIDSQSIGRSKLLNEAIVQTFSEVRDSISAVSLDEEMTNLIRYQHAYAAAAKLVAVAEEMLKTLLGTVGSA